MCPMTRGTLSSEKPHTLFRPRWVDHFGWTFYFGTLTLSPLFKCRKAHDMVRLEPADEECSSYILVWRSALHIIFPPSGTYQMLF